MREAAGSVERKITSSIIFSFTFTPSVCTRLRGKEKRERRRKGERMERRENGEWKGLPKESACLPERYIQFNSKETILNHF